MAQGQPAEPATLEILLARAQHMAGHTVGELAGALGIGLPPEVRRAKGYLGRLLERTLGAAGVDPGSVTDFPALGVELKTLPVDVRGRPRESTFVCHVNLKQIVETDWEHSRVREKLACVLFVPIESARDLAFDARRIGTPVLFRPSAHEQAVLRADFDEIVGRIGRGDLETLSAHVGHALQLRPKAATGRARTRASDADGAPLSTVPRAFYLRATFTAAILQNALPYLGSATR
jgi:DNA mismatch repair protein MutH